MMWSIRDLLLHGAPWEVLPADRPKVEAARRYSRDPHLSKRERGYIARIWLPREEPEPEPMAFVFPRLEGVEVSRETGYPVKSQAPLAAATRRQIPARKIPARKTDLSEPVICNRTADRGSFGANSPDGRPLYPLESLQLQRSATRSQRRDYL